MSYTITNNVMYVRNEAGELVPVSMIASEADQTIAAINTAAINAMAAVEAKVDKQLVRIPEVTSVASEVDRINDDISNYATISYVNELIGGIENGSY